MKKSSAKIYVMLVNNKLGYHLVQAGQEVPKGKVIAKLPVSEFTQNEKRYLDYFEDQLKKGTYNDNS